MAEFLQFIPQMSSTNIPHQQKGQTADKEDNNPFFDINSYGEKPDRAQNMNNDTRLAIDTMRQQPIAGETVSSNNQSAQLSTAVNVNSKSNGNLLTSGIQYPRQSIQLKAHPNVNFHSPWPPYVSSDQQVNSRMPMQSSVTNINEQQIPLVYSQTFDQQAASNNRQIVQAAPSSQVFTQPVTAIYQQTHVQTHPVMSNILQRHKHRLYIIISL